jgi:hypothetical protein
MAVTTRFSIAIYTDWPAHDSAHPHLVGEV